ncbi:MAG: hypothetical protein KDK39_01910 [Leptospiraceae bacterium]|nr:hypothetical protein [Leptospiraceae bacterium]
MLERKRPRLHVFFGAGGVGKTTLSAGYAIHLAQSGRNVGLLSIDPARRLQSALGAGAIQESGTQIMERTPTQGSLHAAMLNLEDSLQRWIAEAHLSAANSEQLLNHPFYKAVAQKIATAIETLAPVRMAEWLEMYPDTDDLIIDTAPGLHAVDFIDRPERMLAFLDSKILEWLKWFAGDAQEANFFQKTIRGGAQMILKGLGKAGGEGILLGLAELLLMLDQVLFRIMDRLAAARLWLQDPQTRIYLVCAVRDDSVAVVESLASILQAKGMQAHATVLNRTIPPELITEFPRQFSANKSTTALPSTGSVSTPPRAQDLLQDYITAMIAMQSELEARLQNKGRVVLLPVLSDLEDKSELRLTDLASLGSILARQLPC